MLAALLLRFHQFLHRNQVFFFLGLISVTGILLYGVSRLRISESIFATLPQGEAFSEFNRLISNRNISNQVVFALNVPEEGDLEAARDTVASFARALGLETGSNLSEITAFRQHTAEDLYRYVHGHFPELIDGQYYKHIRHRLHPDSITHALDNARRRLASPEGNFLKEFILNDPLQITAPYLGSLRSLSGSEQHETEAGMVFINQGRQVLITAIAGFDPGNTQKATELYRQVENFRLSWNTSHPDYKVHYFGTFAIAAKNAIQIKKDALITLVLAVVAIFGLLLLYYRQWSIPVFILTPAAFGGLFALGMIGFVKPAISGISLATGAVLLGIALDYAIHFFNHLRHVRSVPDALGDITGPLITGSLTTILAYSALHFANSEVLKDFGLFAGFALSGALVFTLTCLPALLHLFRFDATALPETRPLFNLPEIPKKYGLPVLVAIGIITVWSYFQSKNIGFDGELQHLSLQDPQLSEAEARLTQIDPDTEAKLFIFSSSSRAEEAASVNYHVYEALTGLKEKGLVESFSSAAPFILPDSLKAARNAEWRRFWHEEDRAGRTLQHMALSAGKLGFSASAFSGFGHWLTGAPVQDEISRDTLLKDLGLYSLIDENAGKTTYITTVIAKKELLAEVKATLNPIGGASVFYRAEMAATLLELVKSDFSYILFISASIVFLALLLLYGRIELALLSFLPMAVSWLWILGLMALLKIDFNFVNVVFATFIFGLGDDFSIFMTDGLLHRYKYGRNHLASYKSAISLSGLTVLIGTGVLLFASHPVLRSIAVVSVPGILCIVVVALVFQPVFFGLIAQYRVEEGRAPVSLLTWIKTWFAFTFFVGMCFLAFVVMLLLIITPLNARRKKAFFTRILSLLSTAVMYSGVQIRKKTYGRENLDPARPAIVIANHSSFLDTMIMLMHYPKAVIMVKEWVYKSPLYGWVIRYANYLFMEEGTDANVSQAHSLVKDGYSIIVFPEGTRSENGRINRFHKGAFYLAEQLQLAVQPVLIHGAGYVSPKNELIIKPGPVNVRIMPRIEAADSRWGENFQQRTKSISRYFRESFASFQKEMDDPIFMGERVFNNFIYKGPVLEWYFRIKWKLEATNYAGYDRMIGHRRQITDLGCGYGFLAFYLHYRDQDHRTITAIDYDKEKISIAENGYDKNDNLRFLHRDVTRCDIPQSDVIFLNDTLHYFSRPKQTEVLHRCISSLRAGGILFIRDGITNNQGKHRNTRLTEIFSTRLTGFNKKTEAFHFFSEEDIRSAADNYGLTFEMKRHSKTTSNVLFILTKPTT